MNDAAPQYDRSLLPPAKSEFVVFSDSHFILDPEPYAEEFNSVRHWPARAAWAWRCAAALEADLLVHLGDLTEENPARAQQPDSRRAARAQFERLGLRPRHVAGNMDIGDKPDPTMWTEWVTPESLEAFHRDFGPSWYAFDRGDLHFVVLNSQLMNGPLPQAAEQQAWAEADLEAHAGRRIVLFMHMPPFFVAEDEPDTGFYNSINEPARSWITGLLRRRQVEALFAGHTHFRAFNRVDATRFYVAPSTTTSRAAFSEAFSVAPAPEQGRNDPAKTGFYLVREYADALGVYFVRMNGQTAADEAEAGWKRLLCAKSRDLPRSPLGAYLRTPLAQLAAGALAWPSVLRQRVRDDHPFHAVLEAGLRHVRAPLSDLEDAVQAPRLQMLRDEGVGLTAVWLWSPRLELAKSVERFAGSVDAVELQVPGELFPESSLLRGLEACRERHGLPVVLTPVIAREATQGKYHPRTRFGYRVEELAKLERHLEACAARLDRVHVHVDPEVSPWDALGALLEYRIERAGAFDLVVRLPQADERLRLRYAAEAVFAAALQPRSRLFFDTLVDLDRTNDLNPGLLDRLSNPHPAYFVVQTLNSILFGGAECFAPEPVEARGADRILGLRGSARRHRLVLPGPGGFGAAGRDALGLSGELALVDLARGWRRAGIRDAKALRDLLDGVRTPHLATGEAGRA
ncbi:MAG: metallophosphoesterase [Planctomycetota bacterium]|nr:metallophosphoesterase [Planctomycetota bacterium]